MPSTPVYLVNPSIVIGATDFTGVCSSISGTLGYDALEITAFGDTGHLNRPGLQTVEITATFYGVYGTGEIEEALSNAVGDGTTTVTIYPSGTTPSVSNPEFTITNTMLASYPAVNQSVGELATFDVTFTGGTWARATS